MVEIPFLRDFSCQHPMIALIPPFRAAMVDVIEKNSSPEERLIPLDCRGTALVFELAHKEQHTTKMRRFFSTGWYLPPVPAHFFNVTTLNVSCLLSGSMRHNGATLNKVTRGCSRPEAGMSPPEGRVSHPKMGGFSHPEGGKLLVLASPLGDKRAKAGDPWLSP
jgi:hypothetical protein